MADKSRVVMVGRDEITIHPINHPESWYPTVYQNRHTKHLDKRFDLELGKELSDEQKYRLGLCVGDCSLGKTEVEWAMKYFVSQVFKAGIFFGFPEQQLRERARKGDIPYSRESWLDLALRYKSAPMSRDNLDEGLCSYLERISVEGVDILFPKNLPYMFI